jgi:uncharacterized protein YjbI with pentapeptide repeats
VTRYMSGCQRYILQAVYDCAKTRTCGVLRNAHSQSQKFLLLHSTEGLSADFRRRAKGEFRVTVTVPAQFFDAPFKWESNPTTATAASRLRNRDLATRIPQPFSSSEPYDAHDDLLATLLPLFRASSEDGPSVHLVAAPAGFGKSHLFGSLFTHLYNDFIDAKKAQTRALRPLPLLPEYLASATAPTLKALVSSFLATDVARPLSLDSFEWMLTRGYACFLLDGLDELIARDPHFFEYLYDLLTRPDGSHSPKVLICVRDSLLASNKGLRDFLDDAGDVVAQHRLTPWKRPSIEAYIMRNRGESTTRRVMSILDANTNLLKLAQTPFYCKVLSDELSLETDSLSMLGNINSGTKLMSLAVTEMVGREFEKRLLAQHWASRDDVESLVQEIAEVNVESGSKGVTIEDVAEYALYSLPDLDEAELDLAVEQLKQLPFFSAASDLGRLSFSQEVIYDYLLGVRATTYFSSHPQRFLHLMGFRPMSQDSATLHVLKEKILEDGSFEDLNRVAMNATGDTIAFKNILRVVLSISEAGWIVRGLNLERQDLSGLLFQDLDLSEVSMRGANLEATIFQGCNMERAVLAEAVLKNTSFDECINLGEAELGDLSTFFSVVVGKGQIEEPDDFLATIGVRAAEGPPTRYVRPCAAASQLRFLFSKFIRPDGAARRDWLDERAVLAGRRYMDPGPVVAAARRHGYLELDPARHRYQRSRGDDYSEMVGLVSKLQLSAKMRMMLAEVCREPGCRHVLDLQVT